MLGAAIGVGNILFVVFQLGGAFLVLTEFPCVVLWRPEALDCRVLIPPDLWSRLIRNPPSLGLEPRTSCIRGRILIHWAIGATMDVLLSWQFTTLAKTC